MGVITQGFDSPGFKTIHGYQRIVDAHGKVSANGQAVEVDGILLPEMTKISGELKSIGFTLTTGFLMIQGSMRSIPLLLSTAKNAWPGYVTLSITIFKHGRIRSFKTTQYKKSQQFCQVDVLERRFFS